MKIAIIGGGTRCKAFLEMFDARRFPKLGAEIVAVADPDLEAPGIRLAREKKIYVTLDYKDFYKIKNLDLVIELTGKADLLEDFLKNKPPRVRVLEAAISRIFGDVLRLREEYQFTKRQINLVEGIMDSLFTGMRDWVLVMQPDFKLLDANVGKDRSRALTARSRAARITSTSYAWLIRFITDSRSHKAADIKRAAKVAIIFEVPADDAYVTLVGRAAVKNSAADVRRLWKAAYDAFFPSETDKANAIFVEIAADRLELWIRGVTPSRSRRRRRCSSAGPAATGGSFRARASVP